MQNYPFFEILSHFLEVLLTSACPKHLSIAGTKLNRCFHGEGGTPRGVSPGGHSNVVSLVV